MINYKRKEEIPTEFYYSVPLHFQPIFNDLGHNECDFSVAEIIANQCLSLPMSPYLSHEDKLK